jgi:Dynamin family
MEPALTSALEELRDELAALELGLEVPEAEEARRVRAELASQIDDYLLPRLRQMDAPLLMVVGGSTGAGKSTLVNSLVGEQVSPAGVLRPTTRAPVLVCHPDDLRWFEDDRVLPGLSRTTGGSAPPGGLELVAAEALTPGLALLDSPDVDSVVVENRALAGQLLAAADSWLFVTTAARYADAVPWELLHAARDRGTALSLVLNRVPEDGAGEVVPHLRQMLGDRGLGDTEILVVPETELREGLLPEAALAPVRRWLDDLAASADARSGLVRRTLTGALDSVPPRARRVGQTLDEQLAVAARLADDVDRAYAAALADVDETVRGGSLLRGEVLARWHDVVGTGDLMRTLETRVGWLRDRVRALVTGRPTADREVTAAVETSVEAVVHTAADHAAERAATAWREHVAGRTLLADGARLDAASAGLLGATASEVRAWQGFVFDLVREEGAGRRSTARLASLGVNGAGLTVMLAVFVQTGGLTGAEIAIAGGTSALSQKVLEAIFGDQAVRALAARARTDLLERVERLLGGEADRFRQVLASVAPAPESPARLRAALDAVEQAR